MRRVLLVDDHQVVRDGLKSIFREQVTLTEFGEASTGADALRLARELEWDLAVVDISLGDKSGLDTVRAIKQMQPLLPILVLSMHSEEQYARRAYKAGAAGYITKDSPRAELAGAIAKVIAGGRYVSPTLAERLVVDLERDTDRPPHHALSDREFEVMRLMGSGKTVGEIAEMLSLSDKTVSTYKARILEKMDLHTTAELIRYVVENKLVD
jgi:two-component system, NarL family, invasion response regulator UvrY